MAPSVVKVNGQGRIARAIKAVRGALQQARKGLTVFRDPRKGCLRRGAQLFAWFLQLLSCWALFAALGLDHQVAIGAAAACLFAVNVTAVVPATPSNIGIFQLAIISVLHQGFGIERSGCACVRRHPPGGRDRDRGRARGPRPGARGRHLVGHALARHVRRTGSAPGAPATHPRARSRADLRLATAAPQAALVAAREWRRGDERPLSVLIRREDELAAVEDALLAARRGESRLRGARRRGRIGKTRLAAELAREARARMHRARWCVQRRRARPALSPLR